MTTTGEGLHSRFIETAGRRLGSVALSWSSGRLTYRGLDEAADRLAAALIVRGVGAETPVAIDLVHGPDHVVAMLAVLKAGGMVVLRDRVMPTDRIADIVAQRGPIVVLDEALIAAATDDPPVTYRPAAVHPGQAAYLLLTTDTARRPKSVLGTHGGLLAYAEAQARNILRPAATRLRHPLRIGYAPSFSPDAAWQPFAALLDGHAVHIVDDHDQREPEALLETIGRYGLDVIDTSPSMFARLRDIGLLTTVPLGVLMLGDEPVDAALWKVIRAECARTGMTAYSRYGPLEAMVTDAG